MKKSSGLLFTILVILVIASIFDRCQLIKKNDRLISQLSEYQIVGKQFETKRLADSSTIATQTQTILTQKEAIQLGFLRLEDKIKEVQSQVIIKTIPKITEKQVPFIPSGYADTTGWVRDTHGTIIRKDSIAVPQRIYLSEKWFTIDGYVKKDGVKIDSLTMPNKTIVTIGSQKSGFLGLGREKVVMVKNENPYVNVTGLNNIVIKNKKKFWQSPIFYTIIGGAAVFYLKK